MKAFFEKIKNLFKRKKLATESANNEVLAVEESTAKPKRKRIRLFDRTPENDIKYRGPLSYRYVRILGWIFQVCFVSSAILSTEIISGIISHNANIAAIVLSYLGELAIPSFLIANFAIILNSGTGTFKKLFKTYILFEVVMLLILFAFMYRYIFQIMYKSTGNYQESVKVLNSTLNASPKIGFALNMFIDLILCSLVWFFLTYRPKKIKGKKVIWFRLLIILPILYEIACDTIKILPIYERSFQLPFYLFPFMTSKPPFTFLAFLIIAVILKFREKLYEKRCGSLDNYDQFLKTNANSFAFSLVTSAIFLIVGILDIISFIFIGNEIAVQIPELSLLEILEQLMARGIGTASVLILFIPILLLFSYTKQHKSKAFDSALPFIGIIAVALSVLETIIDVFF